MTIQLFGYFDGNQTLALEDQPIYTEDWIGLKTLNESGRLQRIIIPGEHVQYYMIASTLTLHQVEFQDSFLQSDLIRFLENP